MNDKVKVIGVGIFLVIITAVIAVSVYLGVKNNQDIRSKATGGDHTIRVCKGLSTTSDADMCVSNPGSGATVKIYGQDGTTALTTQSGNPVSLDNLNGDNNHFVEVTGGTGTPTVTIQKADGSWETASVTNDRIQILPKNYPNVTVIYWKFSTGAAAPGASASCSGRWPADPATECGKSTQSPAQGATDVSLTPDFTWDYGGYRSEDGGKCTDLSSCTNFSVSVYLAEGTKDAKPFARADFGPGSTIVKDAKFSSFRMCDYGNVFPNDPGTCHTDRQPALTTLKSSTTYFWTVTPFYDGVVHAEQTWVYTFTTGSNVLAACQKVTPSKDLTTAKIGDTITFTGYGTLSNAVGSDSIDKINFIIIKDGQSVSDTEVATTLDTAGVWKATKDLTISTGGSYAVKIRAHWASKNSWLE